MRQFTACTEGIGASTAALAAPKVPGAAVLARYGVQQVHRVNCSKP